MFSVGLDPSATCTGLVILQDDNPAPVYAAAIKASKGAYGIGRVREIRTAVLSALHQHVPNGVKCAAAIEGYAYGTSQQLATLVEVGTALRLALLDCGQTYYEPSPSQVQQFVGFKKGKKVKKIKANKNLLKPHLQVAALWGFEHESGDVVDAYVIAQIARAMDNPRLPLTIEQRDVVLSCRHGASVSPEIGSKKA